MSIVKSAKAGKSAIKITKEYLLSKGWTSDKALIYAPKKAHNKNDLYLRMEGDTFILKLKSFENTNDKKAIVKQIQFSNKIYISNIRDLELVENFWYTKDKNKKRKYKKQLLSKAYEVGFISQKTRY
jgi:hypothetical protein